ncbi:MAG: dialkylresorcinol condensing enzyme [Gammaproteobacteria bacterium]|nr:MAG: dialkylresorcinol condensing enzyme [Gammaproteobacteria bacterium]
MKRVLVISYSQTGQLAEVVQSVTAPLAADPAIDLVHEILRPCEPYPFPWPFLHFFNTFPETVYEQPKPIAPLQVDPDASFDLIILAYQVWFLSPAQPVMAFLQSEAATRLLKGRPVMTLIACRNMWLQAQGVMQQHLQRLGARLVDNAVLVDRAHPAATFISTPMWMLTGDRGPFLGGRVPAAGIPADVIANARRFGEAICQQLPDWDGQRPMLAGLGAVTVNERLIASETIARRSFLIWGKLLRRIGAPESRLRRFVLCFYILFLVTMILTVVPISAIIKRLLAPLTRDRIARQRAELAAPSGEGTERMEAVTDVR